MKHCQICGTQFDAETCPCCGEATWIEALPEPKPTAQPGQQQKRSKR